MEKNNNSINKANKKAIPTPVQNDLLKSLSLNPLAVRRYKGKTSKDQGNNQTDRNPRKNPPQSNVGLFSITDANPSVNSTGKEA